MKNNLLIYIYLNLIVVSYLIFWASAEWARISTVITRSYSYAAVVWPYEGVVIASGYSLGGYLIRSTNGGITW